MPRRKLSAFGAARVIFVNQRKIRVRTKEGELHYVKSRVSHDLLPGDDVEIQTRIRNFRDVRQKLVDIVGIVRLRSTYQVVAHVKRLGRKKSNSFTLEAIGLPLRGRIDCRTHKLKLAHGTYVLASLRRHTSKRSAFSVWKLARIIHVLGSQREVAEHVAMTRFGIKSEWNSNVHRELTQFSERISAVELRSRKDLRNHSFVTIDPPTAKDHDDAVYCEKTHDGGYKLFVAIADVAEYVALNSALDKVALKRGTSIYLPSRVIPMLPEKLSNQLCSLKPGVDRLVLVCEMEITAKGETKSFEFYEAVIRSRAALAYAEIAELLQARLKDEIYFNLLNLSKVHQNLLDARINRNAIEFDLPVAEIKFDAAGEVDCVEVEQRWSSQSLIEECMLAANVCAAQFLKRNFNVGMFRVHEPPSHNDLSELGSILRSFDIELPVDGRLSPKIYQNILNQLSNQPELAQAIQVHLLRSLSLAVYSPVLGIHFALNYPEYTHFTSPIRRYPDLVVHRLIKSKLKNVKLKSAFGGLEKIAAEASYLERRAAACTLDAEKWLKVEYMKKYIGSELLGIVIDVKKFGVFVQLNLPYVEGMIPCRDVFRGRYHFNKRSRHLFDKNTSSEFRIGMVLKVRVVEANTELGHIDFELIERVKS